MAEQGLKYQQSGQKTLILKLSKFQEDQYKECVNYGLEPDLILFTAAKKQGHKCFITERKQREMGHNIEPLYCQQTKCY